MKLATAKGCLTGIGIVNHSFAQKNNFKGPWDAAGKVVKSALRQDELTGKRAPTAYACFTNSMEKFPDSKLEHWEQWKRDKDPKLLDKTPWKVTKRYFGYVTDDPAEYDKLKDKHSHVCFSDRANIPTMNAISGSSQFHEVKSTGISRNHGGRTHYQLTTSNKPCRCKFCRGEEQYAPCLLTEWRDTKNRWVWPRQPGDGAPPRDPIPPELKQQVSTILGVDTVTCDILKNYLRGNGLKISGRKLEQMQRVVTHSNQAGGVEQLQEGVIANNVLAITAGVHQEDDLEPQEEDLD